MKTVRSLCALGALAVAAASLFASVPAGAVGTRSFHIGSLDDFKGGDLTGVSIDALGTLHAGLNLGSVPIPDASSVWSSAVLGDGTVLLGTGSEGKVFRIKGGQVELAATTGQMAVSSMAVAWNGDVILGTFPEGKLYKLPAGQKGGTAEVFATLPAGVEDVWGLAFDPKAKALYAATGPDGKLFRIDQGGKAQVHFDSKQPHLSSVAVAEDGTVYAGSNGKALLYKITGPGRATVVHDFGSGYDDVKAIAIAPTAKGGAVYALANKYNESFASPKRNKGGPPGPQSPKAARPGKGLLMRFTANGVGEALLDDDDTHFVSLTLDDDGTPYLGTGSEGRVFTVNDDHLVRLVAKTDQRQIGAMVMAGKSKWIASSDPVVFHEVKGTGGTDAAWTSKVLDAGLRASFGRLTWRATGAIEMSTRSGNTLVPDGTWSAWSGGLPAPGEVKSPAARYVQVRAKWTRDPQATVRDMNLYFVTDNARAVVTSIDAAQRTAAKLRTGMQASGGEITRPSHTIKLSWKTENPDQDELRYRVGYRLEGEFNWRSLLKPGEKLTTASYDWDTSALPEGIYRVMVEASDELANPPDRALKHSLISHPILVDNTPPVFKSLAMRGRRISGEVVDGLGPIARIEVSIAGTDEWRPIFPKDGVFDEASESFDTDLSSMVPAGNFIIAVRAFDTAGNSVSRNIEAK